MNIPVPLTATFTRSAQARHSLPSAWTGEVVWAESVSGNFSLTLLGPEFDAPLVRCSCDALRFPCDDGSPIFSIRMAGTLIDLITRHVEANRLAPTLAGRSSSPEAREAARGRRMVPFFEEKDGLFIRKPAHPWLVRVARISGIGFHDPIFGDRAKMFGQVPEIVPVPPVE